MKLNKPFKRGLNTQRTSKLQIVLKKFSGGCILRKPNFRRKLRILNSRIVPKYAKRSPLGSFNIHSVAKYEETLWRH